MSIILDAESNDKWNIQRVVNDTPDSLAIRILDLQPGRACYRRLNASDGVEHRPVNGSLAGIHALKPDSIVPAENDTLQRRKHFGDADILFGRFSRFCCRKIGAESLAPERMHAVSIRSRNRASRVIIAAREHGFPVRCNPLNAERSGRI